MVPTSKFHIQECAVENIFATNDFESNEKLVAGISYRKINSLPGRSNKLAAANVKTKIVGTKNFSLSMGLSMYQNKRGKTNYGYRQYGYFVTNSLNLSEFSNLTVGIGAFVNSTTLDVGNLEWDNQYVDHVGFDASIPSYEQLNFSSSKHFDFSAGISFKRDSNKKNGRKSINRSLVTGLVISHLNSMPIESGNSELNFAPSMDAFFRGKLGFSGKSMVLLPELYYTYNSGLTDIQMGSYVRLGAKSSRSRNGNSGYGKTIDLGIIVNPNNGIIPAFRVKYGIMRFSFGFEIGLKNQKKSRGVGGGVESNLCVRI